MTPNSIAELISLGLTIPTIALSTLVVLHWHKEAVKAWRTPSKDRDATQWFILGVAVGFAGSVIDNSYWGIAWTAHFLDLPSASWWFKNGVYSNIVARQTAGAIAAYCHVKAAAKASNMRNRNRLATVTTLSFVAGVAFVATLMMIRTASLKVI